MFAFGGVMAVAREKEWAPCSVPTDLYLGCRRAASFPYFGDHTLSPISVLKVRSHSESEGLNKLRFPYAGLDSSHCRIREPLRECEESSDCGSDADSSSSSEDNDSPCASPSLLEVSATSACSRKSVRFADDCGQELYSIRVMTEPNDQPPYLSPRILRRWKADIDDDDKKHELKLEWKMLFRQPASEYVKFRETLERDKVAVENVVVKPEAHKIVGTIKVSNIAFEKKVVVRYTTDSWRTHYDNRCVFQPSTSKIHDTFTFEIELPRPNDKTKEIEFCVFYETNNHTYWDSNNGDNYKIYRIEPELHESMIPTPFQGFKKLDRDDAYKLHNDDWAGFASWKSLSTDHPYCNPDQLKSILKKPAKGDEEKVIAKLIKAVIDNPNTRKTLMKDRPDLLDECVAYMARYVCI